MTKTEGPSARYCFSFIKFAQNFKKIEPMRKNSIIVIMRTDVGLRKIQKRRQ